MTKIWEINTTGAKLLREYRNTNTRAFHLEHKLKEEMETFLCNLVEPMVDFHIFFNDSGKYIVIDTWARQYIFTEEVINKFCEKYKVTYEGVTTEIHTDYEGYESIGKITYLFEIIK